MSECGSYGGWNKHQKEGTEKCGPCLRAKAEYMKAWRRRTGRTTHELIPIRKTENR